MTIGMRFACISEAGSPKPEWIVPGLLFMGNAFRRRMRHGSCTRRLHEPSDRALACDPRAQCGTRIATLVEGAHPLGNLTLARRDRVDLRAHVVVLDRDPGALGDRVEEELGAH